MVLCYTWETGATSIRCVVEARNRNGDHTGAPPQLEATIPHLPTLHTTSAWPAATAAVAAGQAAHGDVGHVGGTTQVVVKLVKGGQLHPRHHKQS
jgi:hypothetical protein